MGRKGNWFGAVKKALGSESKDQKDQKPSKSKKKWFGKKKTTNPIPSPSEAGVETTTTSAAAATTTTTTLQPGAIPPNEAVKLNEIEDEQKQHTSSIAIATAKAAEAAIAAAQAAAEVVRLTNAARFPGKSKEEVAAIRIQTAFRGYQARRVLRALRGLARLKILMQGPTAKRQTANALKSLQTMARVQSQIHARRLRMSEENQTRQRQLLEKHAKELDKLQNLHHNGDDWNTSLKSKEQIAARLQSKHEAAIRRERALAYSFNHQRTWRNSPSTKPAQTLFMDSNNPHWGWSWLESWLAARPWESATIYNPDLAPLRSSLQTPSGAQIAKALLYHVTEKPPSASATSSPRSLHSSSPRATTQKQRNSTGRLSTSAPTSKARPSSPNAKTKTKPANPKVNPRRGLSNRDDEDARSVLSVQSEQNRRQNVAGSSVAGEDVESLASSPATAMTPSYMASTESARAKSKTRSPSMVDSKNETMDRLSVSSAKRRVSYPSSPARSRRSTCSTADANSVGDGK